MHLAEACKLRLLQPGDHSEYAPLLGVLEVGLESDHVEERAGQVVLAELDDRIRPPSGPWVRQTNWTHGAERESIVPAAGKHFDGQAALEVSACSHALTDVGF